MVKHILRITFFSCFLASFLAAFSQNGLYAPLPAWKVLADSNWTGFIKNADGMMLQLPAKASFALADDGKERHGKDAIENENVIDAKRWYGLRFDIQLETDEPFTAFFIMSIPKQTGRHDTPDSTIASLNIQGKGWHTVVLPFASFDYNRGQVGFLKGIKYLSITGKYGQQEKGNVVFKNMELIKGNPLTIDAFFRSRSAGADSAVTYDATITNSAKTVQQVSLTLRKNGWEGMESIVTPAFVTLQPGQTLPFKVSVKVPSLAPEGAQEKQVLVAAASDGLANETIEFITLRRVNGPFLVHTEQGWHEVKDKINNYNWAKQQADEYIKKGDAFEVPIVPEGNLKSPSGRGAIFVTYLEQKFWPVAIAYKLTGEKKYAEKLALLMLRLSAPSAYPTTLFANNADIPQEGGFWEAIARSYDLIKDAGVLSSNEKEQVEHSIRLYIYTLEDGMGYGGISNWSLFNLCPAAQCALVLQDMYHFNFLMDGNGGIKDHLKYGMLDDGWWYEMSLSYNLGCAENVTSVGLAAKPFGIDFLNEKILVSLSQKVGLRPFEFENFEGMAFGKFGPIKNNFITPKRMWDAIVVYPDYRGIMFGMGDGHEHEVGGGVFEEAYFAYRDSNYAAVIKQGSKRDLIYGVPDLPNGTKKLYTLSGHSDNAGIAVLRSQKDGREQKDQIQAAFKYGTHGSYHGHFDRLSLLSLMRYGRSFYNPETSWFGYGSYMYKWWVQPSMSHNMVVVDGKQQEPVESKTLLFHTGKMMQVIGAETNARWSNPPYFGGYDQLAKVKSGDAPFVPIPQNHPQPADVTNYTEPVLQRRVLIVTDDYVVTADYLKAATEHTFDNLLQLRNAKASENVTYIGHSEQFDPNPLSSGQFITNVEKYDGEGTVGITSLAKFGNGFNYETGGQKSISVPGDLHLDAYGTWPLKIQVLVGNYAEAWPINKKMRYEVWGDGKLLASDSLGTWILGKSSISINTKNIKTLQLKVFATKGNNSLNTLFWADAAFETKSGKNVLLSSLPYSKSGLVATASKGKDYGGGEVVIAGNPYSDVLPAEPESIGQPSVIDIDISNLGAVKFSAIVGGDYPVGMDEQVRRTVSFRTIGKTADFLTVIEPYENKKMIKKVTSKDAGTIEVELNDGRIQQISIAGLKSVDGKVGITLKEFKNSKLVREENSDN